MKVLILFLIFVSSYFAQVSDLYSVYFINDSLGFTSGTHGTVLKTTDGGENWESTVLNAFNTLRDVFFINSKVGFVVGDNHDFYCTTDEGNSWNFKSNDLSDIGSVWFRDSLNGWVTTNYRPIGVADGLYRTTNGGLIWTKQKDGWYEGLFFIDSLGFAVDAEGQVLKSTDFGTSWNEFNCFGVLTSVYFPNTVIGYVIAGNSWLTKRIYKSTDSGETWINKWQKNDNSSLTSIWFFNENQGIICGSTNDYKGRLLLTNDGGNNWQEIDTFDNILNDIYFVNDSLGWTVGSNGAIYKLEKPIVVNVNENPLTQNNKDLILKVYPNPFNSQTILNYILPQDGNVRIVLFNTLGAKVAELVNEYRIAGEYRKIFQTDKLATGIYYLLLEQNNYSVAEKIIFLK